MIYNDEFVWLHFPRCAGTKIEKIFETYFLKEFGVCQDLYRIKDNPLMSWHDTISERESRCSSEFSLGSRTILCSIRRLPGWLQSRYNYECKRSPALPHDPKMLLNGFFLEYSGAKNHADYYVQKYLPKKIIQSGRVRFIRTEFFELDFKSIFGDYLDIARVPSRILKKRINTSYKRIPFFKDYLPPDVKQRLHYESEKVYSKCPYWRYIEELAYGNIKQE